MPVTTWDRLQNTWGIKAEGISEWSLHGMPACTSFRGFHVEFSLNHYMEWGAWKERHEGQLGALLDFLTLEQGYFVIDRIEIQKEELVFIHRRGSGGVLLFRFGELPAEGIGERVAIGVMNPNGLTKLELSTEPDPADRLADSITQKLEENGIDPTGVVVVQHDVDYGPDAPITKEVVGVVLDSRIIPKDNPLHDLVKAREEDVRRGRIVQTSMGDLGSDVPPFMRRKEQLP